MAFNGKRTKTARSQGKKFQVSIEQEATRLLGNLGWAYMQQNNYIAAEAVYRKALTIEPDNNKMCNLGICLMKQGRVAEAKAMLQCVKPASADGPWGLDSHLKSYERAQEMLKELESQSACSNIFNENPESEALKSSVWQPQPCCPRQPSTRKQQNHKPVPDTVGNGSTTYLATAGFGPLQQQKLLLVPPEAPTSQFSMFSTNGYWEEKGDNNDAFGDENVNVNINMNRNLLTLPYHKGIGTYTTPGELHLDSDVNINMNGPPVQSLPPLGAGYQMQRHAETLRQKLEQVCLKENGNPSKPTFPPPIANNTERILNSAAPPFFCRNTQGNEQRMPLTLDRTNDQKIMPFAEQNKFVLGNRKDNHPKAHNKNRPTSRRSLSFESVDEGLDLLLHQPQPTHNNKTLTKCNSISLPLQDKADPWPDNEEFENAILAALCESNPSSHDDKIQRRLRVFQEMTLSSPIA